MHDQVIAEAREKMEKACEILRKELITLRVGRATPALLEKVMVDYYGVPTPVNQLAKISAPEPRLLVVEPYDKSVINGIEKAILKSELGLTPNNDGNIIRIVIPQLTQERRNELVKFVRKKAEEARVAVRNVRRDANDRLKQLAKNGEISEDESKRAQEEVQKLTDKYIDTIDDLLEKKEKEIMEV